MRYSKEKKSEVHAASTHEEFLEIVLRKTSPIERTGGLLLVGGSSSRHQIVRRAQAPIRFDSLPSYWSHAAVILAWEREPDRAIGSEVTWEPWSPDRQVSERNGVTLFPLSRYLGNPDQYPNLAFASLSFRDPKPESKSEVKMIDYRSAIRDAALDPNQDRFRYRLLDWLRIWGGYTYQPHGQPNPLLNEVPVPGAAYCEYAFEAAGIDLTPGATAPNGCPELLWSTLLYWQKRIGEHVEKVNVFTFIGDPFCKPRKPLPPTLDEDLSESLDWKRRSVISKPIKYRRPRSEQA